MFAFVTTVFAQSTVVGPISPQGVDRPVRKVGASCSYDKTDDWKGAVVDKYTETVTAVTDSGYDLSVTHQSGAVGRIRQTLNLNNTEDEGTLYTPDTGTYSFPLHVGKDWKIEYTYQRSNGIHGRRVYTAKVVAEELIDIPGVGNQLSALKIQYDGYVNSVFVDGSAGKGNLHMTVWYAPAVGCVGKTKFEGTDYRGVVIDRISYVLTAFKP
jgi:hypothetical protein